MYIIIAYILHLRQIIFAEKQRDPTKANTLKNSRIYLYTDISSYLIFRKTEINNPTPFQSWNVSVTRQGLTLSSWTPHNLSIE